MALDTYLGTAVDTDSTIFGETGLGKLYGIDLESSGGGEALPTPSVYWLADEASSSDDLLDSIASLDIANSSTPTVETTNKKFSAVSSWRLPTASAYFLQGSTGSGLLNYTSATDSKWAIAGWVRPYATTGTYFRNGHLTIAGRAVELLYASGNLRARVGLADQSWLTVTSTVSISADNSTWYSFIIQLDGTNSDAYIGLQVNDETIVTATDLTQTFYTYAAAYDCKICGSAKAGISGWAVFDSTILTSGQRTTWYNSGTGTYYSGGSWN